MTQTILLADDSTTIQRLVTQTFDGGDYTVVSVSNGEAALRKFEEVRPSIVLADIYMPGKNGYEVCSFVKEHPVLGKTPVVLLVGAFEEFDAAEAERVSADGRINKPFEPQELLEMVFGMIADAGGVHIEESDEDILGLRDLFPELDLDGGRGNLSGEEIDAIADRVIQRLSVEVIEGIAWEVVPEIADRAVNDELKKRNED